MGGQASWLLPAALLALVAGLWARRRAPRTDRARAALLLWGGWLVVTAIVFSFGQGVIHTYYTVAIAPAIGALVAIGGALLWPHRDTLTARALAAVAVGGSAAWAYVLLDRTPSWEPWLRPLVLICGALAVLGLLAAPALGRRWRRAGVVVAVLGVVACTAGPLAYSAQTITTAHTGSIPSAGPASAGGFGGGAPGGFARGAQRAAGRRRLPRRPPTGRRERCPEPVRQRRRHDPRRRHGRGQRRTRRQQRGRRRRGRGGGFPGASGATGRSGRRRRRAGRV